jgi:hypothetical protein
MNESLRKKIEARAFHLFLKRGGVHGYHLEDWAKAEKEVLAEEGGQKPSVAQKIPVQSNTKPAAQAKNRKR